MYSGKIAVPPGGGGIVNKNEPFLKFQISLLPTDSVILDHTVILWVALLSTIVRWLDIRFVGTVEIRISREKKML
jgi:hypothetical protein